MNIAAPPEKWIFINDGQAKVTDEDNRGDEA